MGKRDRGHSPRRSDVWLGIRRVFGSSLVVCGEYFSALGMVFQIVVDAGKVAVGALEPFFPLFQMDPLIRFWRLGNFHLLGIPRDGSP